MKRLVLAGAMIAGLAGPGFAADYSGGLPNDYFAPWTGVNVGVFAGGGWADVDWSESLTGEAFSFGPSGFIGGAEIGYDRQFGNFVFGVEASIAGAGISETVNSAIPGITFASSIDGLVAAKARIGYAAGRWLIYADGGYAGGWVNVSGNNPGFPDRFSDDGFDSGWTVGGGVEYMITANTIFGIDYSFVDLGSTSRSGTTNAGLAYTISGLETQVHTVVARLKYKFGGPR